MPGVPAPTSSASQSGTAPGDRAVAVLRSVETALRTTAFWSAAVLPLAYLPVLAGLDVGQYTGPFLTLLALHHACLVVGHDHAPSPHD